VAQRPSFMHTGLMGTLDEVVDFFNRGGDVLGYPGENVLTPLNLSREEQRALIAFLRALTPSSGP
jgi:cytochrome c peroxidase